MAEIISMGALQLAFLECRELTGNDLDLFEMTLQPEGRMPIPHYHESWDETVYGLEGTSVWRVDGNDVELRPGATVFIRRGIVHGFDNRSGKMARCLCILTPGVLGPRYFREMAALLAAEAPDLAKMKETMLRCGLVPAPAG